MFRTSAFSLLEICIALLIIGIIALFAMPNLTYFLHKQALSIEVSQLQSFFRWIRFESLQLKQPICVCPSVESFVCSQNGNDPWIAFTLSDPKQIVGRCENPSLKSIHVHFLGFGGANHMVFYPSGMVFGNGRFIVSDEMIHVRKELILSKTGRMREDEGAENNDFSVQDGL